MMADSLFDCDPVLLFSTASVGSVAVFCSVPCADKVSSEQNKKMTNDK
jgi:hypothetical protein